MIGCDCAICQSGDPRDHRLRTAIFIEASGLNIAVDAGPDFRQQMLRAKIKNLDAILLTHEHNDHIIGIDDVRPFNFMQWQDMPVYAVPRVQNELKKRFAYIFQEENRYPGAPMLKLHTIDKAYPFKLGELEIQPVEVIHGRLPVLGFRIGTFAYVTDMKTIVPEEFEKLKGLSHLVLNALHHKEHHSHLNLEEAIAFAKKVGAENTYFTHISHRMGLYDEINDQLPQGIQLAYDGLRVQVG